MLGYTWLISNYYVLHYTLTIIVYYLHCILLYDGIINVVTVPAYTRPDTERHNMDVPAVWPYGIQ